MESEQRGNLAVRYMEMGRHSKALQIIKELLSDNPEEGYYLFLMGECLNFLKEFDQAIEYIKDAIDAGFDFERCQFQIACIYFDWGIFSKCKIVLEDMMNRYPLNSEAMALYARARYEVDEFPYKFNRFYSDDIMIKAIELDHENVFVLRQAFWYYLKRRKFKLMRRAKNTYLRLSTSERDKLEVLAEYEAYSFRYRKAAKLYKQVFLLNPEDAYIIRRMKSYSFPRCINTLYWHLYGLFCYVLRIQTNDFMRLIAGVLTFGAIFVSFMLFVIFIIILGVMF